MLQLGKTLYHQGDLSYFEAVNKETLKNAYDRCTEEGIIMVRKSKDSKVPTTIRLADDWRPRRNEMSGRLLPEGRLWSFADTISQSRREGKNRRDGTTVITRVLNLVDLCGRQLFDDARAKDAPETRPAEDREADGKRRRRRIAETTARL